MEIKANIIRSLAAAAVAALVLTPPALLTSCRKQVRPTAIQIVDSVRHYPATILGQDLTMEYVVRNIGSDMLVITDVQPAVPTIEADKDNPTMIPPGKEGRLKFTFHTDMNIGLARHVIRVFGNIVPHGVAEIVFDTHVVRPSTDLIDYEEYHREHPRPDDTDPDLGGRNLDMEYTTGHTDDGRDSYGDVQYRDETDE